MDKLKELEALLQAQDLSVGAFLLNFAVALLLAMLTRWHYLRYSTVLANRHDLANVLPLLTLTVMLVIAIVKSSLALSLGLVGALSIVRFRTPMKEPEDLGYIFVAIAIGLGTGASQTIVTLVAIPLILAGATLAKLRGKDDQRVGAYNLSVRLQKQDASTDLGNRIVATVAARAALVDVSRIDLAPDSMSLLLNIELRRQDDVSALMDEIRALAPSAQMTFLDHRTVSRI